MRRIVRNPATLVLVVILLLAQGLACAPSMMLCVETDGRVSLESSNSRCCTGDAVGASSAGTPDFGSQALSGPLDCGPCSDTTLDAGPQLSAMSRYKSSAVACTSTCDSASFDSALVLSGRAWADTSSARHVARAARTSPLRC